MNEQTNKHKIKKAIYHIGENINCLFKTFYSLYKKEQETYVYISLKLKKNILQTLWLHGPLYSVAA